MGVQFDRMKIILAEDGTKKYQVWSGEGVPTLTPLISITRVIPEGRSQKISQPFMTTTNDIQTFNTIWQPMGQEGWTVKIQATLWYRENGTDEIASWLALDSSELISVGSNCVNAYGEEDLSGTHKPYLDLPLGTMWYVDHILISSVDGTPNMAKMELTLIRCWEVS